MISSEQPREIAIYYSCFAGGGAEAVALWMLQALKDKYKITLVTIADLDWSKLNSMYGTTLSPDSVKILPLFPRKWGNLIRYLYSNNKHFRQLVLHYNLRRFKQNGRDKDLLISAYNAADLGKRGIQYIHWIKVLEGDEIAKKFYNRVSQFSEDNLKKNISLANSKFVAKSVQDHYGITATVVYPPVVINPGNTPWEEKEDAFICSGRLVKAKEPHRVIECLKKVREKGFKVKLYITGGGGGIGEATYKNYLDRLIKENSEWIQLFSNLSYEDYAQLLYRCKYGIHFKPEPFGISIAEMVKAGQIPFVRGGWGPMEIVGEENTDLFFSSFEEAIEKISAVLGNTEKQAALQLALEKQKDLFSTTRFMEDIQRSVQLYFDENRLPT